MFIISKMGCFQMWFIDKSDLRISTVEKHIETIKKKPFQTKKNDDIFHIIDKNTVSWVPS